MLIIGRRSFGRDPCAPDELLPFRHVGLDRLAKKLRQYAGGDQSLLGQGVRNGGA
jgi:hypothetical protein